jgi:hypothetical protein
MAVKRMVGQVETSRAIRGVNAIGGFLSSGFFALLIIMTVVLWTAVMIAVMAWPQTFTPVSSFAGQLKIWCFGYDPVTGKVNMAKLAMLVLDPIFLALLVYAIWRKAVHTMLRTQRRLTGATVVLSALIVVGGLTAVPRPSGTGFRPGSRSAICS